MNGRFVRDRAAAWAVGRAYAGTLPQGRYPAGAIFVELPLDRVDVNVHPQKLEVRFADPRAVQGAIHRVVSEALRLTPWLRHRPPVAPEGARAGAEGDPWSPAETTPPSVAAEEVAGLLATAKEVGLRAGALAPLPGLNRAFDFPSPPSGPVTSDLAGLGGETASPEAPAGYFGRLRYIGQHARTYLLCEAPGGSLVVIDQHASHERLLFHRLREAHRARQLAVQPLLVPQLVTLPPGPARALEAGQAELRAIGLELEPFGGDTFAVKGAPAILGGSELAGLVADLGRQLERFGGESALEEALHDVLATVACHAAVRAHQELSDAEARALLDGLDAIDYKARCPHGRPVVFELPLVELERRVGRR